MWPSSGEFDNCMKMKGFNKLWNIINCHRRLIITEGTHNSCHLFIPENENSKQPHKKEKQSTSMEVCKGAIFCLARSNKRTDYE